MDAALDRWRDQLSVEETRVLALEAELAVRRERIEQARRELAAEWAELEGIREALQVFAGQASALMEILNNRAAGLARSVALAQAHA